MKRSTEKRLKTAMKHGRQLQLWFSFGEWRAAWAGECGDGGTGSSVDEAIIDLLEQS